MKERPIIFSTEMVKAILEGRKTQTRRVIKPQPVLGKPWHGKGATIHSAAIWTIDTDIMDLPKGFCPYGQVGDRLWVRETWQQIKAGIAYKASWDAKPDWKWKPPIFMPRWASRVMLEITEVRVEKLQEITEKDSLAEGLIKDWFSNYDFLQHPVNKFCALWDSLNAKRGYGWETNPWVWVISFRRLENVGNKVRRELWNQLAFAMNEGRKLGMSPLDGSERAMFDECIDQILSIPELTIVDREAELPRILVDPELSRVENVRAWKPYSKQAG